MSIFSILSGRADIEHRRQAVARQLSAALGAVENAERAVEIIARLEVDLPREIEVMEGSPHCPHLASLWGGSIERDIDPETVQLVEQTAALRRLLSDLPRLKQHWNERLVYLRKHASTPAAEAMPTRATSARSAESQPAQPDTTSIENLPIGRVLDMVDAGEISAERALELEKSAKRPRPSLIQQLQGYLTAEQHST
jgi:hypothetical protein